MVQKLAEILEGLDTGLARSVKICNQLTVWDRVVDERVRRHTEAVKIKFKVLYVTTSSPAWAQELGFLKQRFIEKFNAEAGQEVISDIRFKSGPGPGGSGKKG
jgi:predicted nucleic acid-binding Zn ribbon protein